MRAGGGQLVQAPLKPVSQERANLPFGWDAGWVELQTPVPRHAGAGGMTKDGWRFHLVSDNGLGSSGDWGSNH
jgi:hypothetical protein